MALAGKKIVVALTGGIACYKIPYLVRFLVKAGVEVRVVMTENAKRFITPLTMETVSRHAVCHDMWADRDKDSIQHIELANWADLIVVAPATANILAKAAHGLCDDLLSTVLCATQRPIMVAPAMNPGMWHNSVTQKNVKELRSLGYRFVGPAEGEMAEKQVGVGRMVEPLELGHAIEQFFVASSKKKALSGRKVIVTAGPCREAIDPVRYISNRSSGKMGYAIARAARELGAETTLISGPTSLTPPEGVHFVTIETTAELLEAVRKSFPKVDCLVMAAAPSDFTPARVAKGKIKRTASGLDMQLTPTKDILKEIGKGRKARQLLVGFALETDNEEANARKKLTEKHLDMIVVNNPHVKGAGFEHDTNQVTLITPKRPAEKWPLMSKDDVALKLMERVAVKLAEKKK